MYLTAVSAAISELIGYIFSGWLLERFGIRKSFVISSIFGTVGGVSILLFGLDNEDSLIFPFLFLITKIGQSCSLNLTYTCLAKLFEVKRATRVLGVAQFCARLVATLAPLVSTLEQPTPMLIFCTSTFFSGLMTCFFKEPPHDKPCQTKQSLATV